MITQTGMKNGLTSIIIPMYNASLYIGETLESVRSQKYKNWELIIVDDGSTDSSVVKVQDFISKYPNEARLLQHPNKKNRGTSASRNLGMKHAIGEFVCFLDADDVWEPDFLGFFVGVLEKNHEISMAYGPALLWHMNQNSSTDYVQHLGIKTNKIVDPYDLFKMFLVGEADTPSPSGVMIRRNAILEVGGWEEAFPGMYDDQVLYSKLLLRGGAVYVADKCLYRYRQHSESLCKMSTRERRNADSRKKYLEWLKQYLKNRGQFAEDVEIIIAEHMWYAHRQKEIEILSAAGWWTQKTSALRSLATLLGRQKNFISAIKLCGRIVGQQVASAARTSKDSRH